MNILALLITIGIVLLVIGFFAFITYAPDKIIIPFLGIMIGLLALGGIVIIYLTLAKILV